MSVWEGLGLRWWRGGSEVAVVRSERGEERGVVSGECCVLSGEW